jgi:predicted MarR family transcription regulator
MTVTTTSRLAYKQLNTEHIGNTQKNKIMEIVKNNDKGLSLREICLFTDFDINAVSGRVNDLKKENLLETTTKRKCSITNRLISPVIIKKL